MGPVAVRSPNRQAAQGLRHNDATANAHHSGADCGPRNAPHARVYLRQQEQPCACVLRKMLCEVRGHASRSPELMAEVLGDTPGALWKLDPLGRRSRPCHSHRCRRLWSPSTRLRLTRRNRRGWHRGRRTQRTGTVRAQDLSGRMSPTGWATTAVLAYAKWKPGKLHRRRGQSGGDMVGTDCPVDGEDAATGQEADRAHCLYDRPRVQGQAMLALSRCRPRTSNTRSTTSRSRGSRVADDDLGRIYRRQVSRPD